MDAKKNSVQTDKRRQSYQTVYLPQSHRVTPLPLPIQVGEIFLCPFLINSPTRFARRGIKERRLSKCEVNIFIWHLFVLRIQWNANNFVRFAKHKTSSNWFFFPMCSAWSQMSEIGTSKNGTLFCSVFQTERSVFGCLLQ